MSINKQAVEKIARLAKLAVEEADLQKYENSLNNVLALIELINPIDTTGISPMAHPISQMTQRLREDKVTEEDHHQELQAIAPDIAADLYCVPTVIESQ